ncbi:MAG: hypothetical protein HY760_07355 [Nitrospirae bacterium]|nr:hypothetical protein [Nitrospirota bacterium]
MKDFGNRKFRLGESPRETRLAYTGFLIFAFIGYFTIVLLGALRVGPDYDAIVSHYRGSDLDEMSFPRPFGQMLEETHLHAFIEGVVLLVLTHLFAATGVSGRMKAAFILLAFGGTLGSLASPWLIKYLWPGFAYLQMTSWVVMGTSALALIVVPLHEMWFGPSRRGGEGGGVSLR